MPSADTRGWGPGWPRCQTSKIVSLHRSDGLVLPVNQGIVQIVAHLCDETERRGYDLRPGQCWGFSCRNIRGYPKVPSEHSWGTAVDLNAPANPMLHGKPGWDALHRAGRTDMPQWMPPLWEGYMFRWGGNYATRQDAMHYEFMGTPADAARITASLHNGTAPGQAGLPLVLQHGTTTEPYTRGQTARAVQEMLVKWNNKYHVVPVGLTVDGVYGKDTARYIVAFKHWVREFQRAFKQPVWPNEDTTCGVVTYGALQFWTK